MRECEGPGEVGYALGYLDGVGDGVVFGSHLWVEQFSLAFVETGSLIRGSEL